MKKQKNQNKNERNEETQNQQDLPLRIIPLGGLKEVGKNMTAYEYDDSIIVVDTGIMFPDEKLLGVDVVIPDVTYLEQNAHKLKGFVYTHGHEDHIGASPYMLKKFKVPIHGTKLTLELIKKKLKEHNVKGVRMHERKAGDTFRIGPFRIEMIHVNHSIPDACALHITTKAGNVLQTGDFKVDYTPVSGGIIDLARLGAIGEKGVDLLLSDSTNAERPGKTMSESSVGDTFDQLFRNAKGRLIVASFASNLDRIQQIFNSAKITNRKIAFTGRSMNTLSTIGMKVGLLQIPENDIIDIRDINQYPDNEIVVITTGSQGEPMAALTRMAEQAHYNIQVKEGDTVILSSSPIPGNEKSVKYLIDKLLQLGVEVIYSSLADVHVSGHACQDELRLMLALVKPKNFMPVHGEYSMLKQHADLAYSQGVKWKNIFIVENGDIVELRNGKVTQTEKVPAGRVLVDGLTIGDVGTIVLKERKQLSEDGLAIVLLKMDKNQLAKEPDIISRGFIHIRDSEDLIEGAKKKMLDDIQAMSGKDKNDWSAIKNLARDSLNRYIYSKTKRNPMILVFIQEG